MPQIRVTNKAKEMLDAELEKQKQMARDFGEPIPSMAYVSDVIIFEGLASLEKARKRQEKKNETNR